MKQTEALAVTEWGSGLNVNVVLYTILDMLELRDGYTGSHVQNVENYISLLTDEMRKNGKWDLSVKDAYRISQAALLHDTGKIAVPDAILLKPGRLTPEEFHIIKAHTTLGAEALKKSMALFEESELFRTACNITRYHHERWDGSGYPDGLSGGEIPLEARIAAIADVYDALRSERPYKPPMDRQKTRDIILEGKGTSFDPDLIEIFLIVEEKFNDYDRVLMKPVHLPLQDI